jgi:hypothetical protein
MAGDMTEADPSGYDDSPDTVDTAPGADSEGSPTLTTDDDAQRSDSVERPGNEPD